jgi:hypothetical protein
MTSMFRLPERETVTVSLADGGDVANSQDWLGAAQAAS